MTLGNCYESAYLRLMENPGYTLVHAEVTGSAGGAAPGRRFGHAWLEREEKVPGGTFLVVEDYSNGREIEIPAELYYHLGEIVKEPGKHYRYSLEEALRWANITENYGSWELEIEGHDHV